MQVWDEITVLYPKPFKEGGRANKATKKITFFRKDRDWSRGESGELQYEVKGYPSITYWSAEVFRVESLQDMCKVLYRASMDERAPVVVRGRPIDLNNPRMVRAGQKTRFGEPGLLDVDRRWLCVDLDDTSISHSLSTEEDCANACRILRDALPRPFNKASCAMQISSTSTPAKVKAHAWFWLPDFVCNGGLSAWAKQPRQMPVDRMLYTMAQPHYIAPPTFSHKNLPPEFTIAKRWNYIAGEDIRLEDLPEEFVGYTVWEDLQEKERKQRFQNVNTRIYDESTTPRLVELMADDIRSAGAGQRHYTAKDKIYRVFHMIMDGELPLSSLDVIKSAALDSLIQARGAKEGEREVERLIENLERRYGALSCRYAPSKPSSTRIKRKSIRKATSKKITKAPPQAPPTKAPRTPPPVEPIRPQTPEEAHLRKTLKSNISFEESIAFVHGLYEGALEQVAGSPNQVPLARALVGRHLNRLNVGWTSNDLADILLLFKRVNP